MGVPLHIDEDLAATLEAEAEKQGCTPSEVIEKAVRRLSASSNYRLPILHSGGHLVNIDDREELYRAMEGA